MMMRKETLVFFLLEDFVSNINIFYIIKGRAEREREREYFYNLCL